MTKDNDWIEKAQFWMIFVLSFFVLFVSAAISRLLPWRRQEIGRNRSIFTTASKAAGAVSAFAFMG